MEYSPRRRAELPQYPMPFLPSFLSSKLLVLGACLAAAVAFDAQASPRTVCTITVNSPDEKESFRRHLTPGDSRLLELVERGRPDWLA